MWLRFIRVKCGFDLNAAFALNALSFKFFNAAFALIRFRLNALNAALILNAAMQL
jgi:hypothetical protein